jgi:hypothetical protein
VITAPVPQQYLAPATAARISLIAHSFEALLGRPLVTSGDELASALWTASFPVVAHGGEPDPIFFFGNRAALEAFECDVESFTRMPSRLSAEAVHRDERQRMLERVSREGFVSDVAGVRVSAKGRRFRIANGIIWNLIDERGLRQGQAATFML